MSLNKFAFNKESPIELISQLVKVLGRRKDQPNINSLINRIKTIGGEIFEEWNNPSLQHAASKGEIILEDGVYYMIVDGKKMPIDIDAPPSFRANIIDQVLKEANWPK